MESSSLFYGKLSEEPGIYLFLDDKGKVLYVGKAKNIKKRVASYFNKTISLDEKTKVLVSKIKKIKTIKTSSEIESLLLEASSIKKHLPFYNIKLTDNKAYPLIKITIKDEYPKVLLTREEDDKKSIYFGPFPNTAAMKLVLKTIRKIFPYQSVLNHPNRICLYNHLNLCPCPSVFPTAEKKQEYLRNIKHLISFLKGKTKDVIKELEEERESLSRNEEFEKAKVIQKKLEAIKLITSPIHKPFEYDLNPNLAEDIAISQSEVLKEELESHGIPVKKLERIECYDISNTQGKKATGSMVVFVNGEKDKSKYRRFKINFGNEKPNDFKMLSEILERRFKHLEWQFPNLIIVDGGKGQVSSAKKVLNKMNLNIPLIGLAKREETIITSNFDQISLPKSSKALFLLIKIRNEAHRFAINYHKKLRSKAIFE